MSCYFNDFFMIMLILIKNFDNLFVPIIITISDYNYII